MLILWLVFIKHSHVLLHLLTQVFRLVLFFFLPFLFLWVDGVHSTWTWCKNYSTCLLRGARTSNHVIVSIMLIIVTEFPLCFVWCKAYTEQLWYTLSYRSYNTLKFPLPQCLLFCTTTFSRVYLIILIRL